MNETTPKSSSFQQSPYSFDKHQITPLKHCPIAHSYINNNNESNYSTCKDEHSTTLPSDLDYSSSPISIFNPISGCINMHAYLNSIPMSVHKEIHTYVSQGVWKRLRTLHSNNISEDEPRNKKNKIAEAIIHLQKHDNQITTRLCSVSGVRSLKILQLYSQTEPKSERSSISSIKERSISSSSSSLPSRSQFILESNKKHSIPSTASLSKQPLSSLSRSLSNVSQSLAGKRTSTQRTLLEDILRLKQRPIILVPTAATVLLNDINIVEFLQNGKFVEHTSKIHSTNGIEPSRTIVTRQIDGRQIRFRIVEASRALRFGNTEWASVVAVIVVGPTWQFHKWPFNKFEDIFVSIKGFFFCYPETKVPSNVHQWNVQVMRLSRNQRHYDGPIQHEFWRILEEFLIAPRENRFSKTAELTC